MEFAKKPRYRVLLVDDSRIILTILDRLISSHPDLEVVGTADSVEQAIREIAKTKPDIITIDLLMPYLDGRKLLGLIEHEDGICKIIVSGSVHGNVRTIDTLLAMGAHACIDKSQISLSPEDFCAQIMTAATEFGKLRKVRGYDRLMSAVATFGAHSTLTRRYPMPRNEVARLEAVYSLGLCNAERERQLDLITAGLAKMAGYPICLMTFIDENTQWLKSSFGLNISSTPRAIAFCNYTICQEDVFAVENATMNPLFFDNVLVKGTPSIRTYVGYPLTSRSGVRLGALCLIDNRPRKVTTDTMTHIRAMGAIVSELLRERADRRAA